MEAWKRQFPEDVIADAEFWAQRKAEREAYHDDRRRRKAFINDQLYVRTTIDDEDPRWDDLWTASEDTVSDDGEE